MKALSPIVATILLFSYPPSSASPLRDCRDGCDSEFQAGPLEKKSDRSLRRRCRRGCRRAADLVGRRWSVARYRSGGGDLVSVLPGSDPTLVLTTGGNVGANSGCNNLVAPYGRLTGETFDVLPGALVTRRGCPDELDGQEKDLFGLLAPGTVGWAVVGSGEGAELTLSDPETGGDLMVLLSLPEGEDGDEGGGGDRAADDCLRSCGKQYSGGGSSHASEFSRKGLAACEAECAGEGPGPVAEPRDRHRKASGEDRAAPADRAPGRRGGDRREASDGDGTGGKESAENDAVPLADGAPLGPTGPEPGPTEPATTRLGFRPCTREYAPVCGADLRVYSNRCQAENERVAVMCRMNLSEARITIEARNPCSCGTETTEATSTEATTTMTATAATTTTMGRAGERSAWEENRHKKRSEDNRPAPPEKRSMGRAGERSAWEENRHKKRSEENRHRKHSEENRPAPPEKRSMGRAGERSAWEENRHRKRSEENHLTPPEKRSMGRTGERSAWEENRHRKRSEENRPAPPPPRPLPFDGGEGQDGTFLPVSDLVGGDGLLRTPRVATQR